MTQNISKNVKKLGFRSAGDVKISKNRIHECRFKTLKKFVFVKTIFLEILSSNVISTLKIETFRKTH